MVSENAPSDPRSCLLFASSPRFPTILRRAGGFCFSPSGRRHGETARFRKPRRVTSSSRERRRNGNVRSVVITDRILNHRLEFKSRRLRRLESLSEIQRNARVMRYSVARAISVARLPGENGEHEEPSGMEFTGVGRFMVTRRTFAYACIAFPVKTRLTRFSFPFFIASPRCSLLNNPV